MSQNVFRLSGDACHVIGILFLLWKVIVGKNAQGMAAHTTSTDDLGECADIRVAPHSRLPLDQLVLLKSL
jgi:hypothetical protein